MTRRRGVKWNEDEEEWVYNALRAGWSVADIADAIERTFMAVLARLARNGNLGFVDNDECRAGAAEEEE